jgi:hypothetical protein
MGLCASDAQSFFVGANLLDDVPHSDPIVGGVTIQEKLLEAVDQILAGNGRLAGQLPLPPGVRSQCIFRSGRNLLTNL